MTEIKRFSAQPSSRNNWGWNRLKPGTRNYAFLPWTWQGPQYLSHQLLLSKGHEQGNWITSGVFRTWIPNVVDGFECEPVNESTLTLSLCFELCIYTREYFINFTKMTSALWNTSIALNTNLSKSVKHVIYILKKYMKWTYVLIYTENKKFQESQKLTATDGLYIEYVQLALHMKVSPE